MSIIRNLRGKTHKDADKAERKFTARAALRHGVVAENEPVVPFPRTYFV